jgi:hypothetical protein
MRSTNAAPWRALRLVYVIDDDRSPVMRQGLGRDRSQIAVGARHQGDLAFQRSIGHLVLPWILTGIGVPVGLGG